MLAAKFCQCLVLRFFTLPAKAISHPRSAGKIVASRSAAPSASAAITTTALQDCIDDDAKGISVADCRITRASGPGLTEWMKASNEGKPAGQGALDVAAFPPSPLERVSLRQGRQMRL